MKEGSTKKVEVDKQLIFRSLIRNEYSFDTVWKAGYYGIIYSFGDYSIEDLARFVCCFNQIKSNDAIKAYINNKYHAPKNKPKHKSNYMGIYQIVNKKTRECYIGSSNNVSSRLKGHKRLLERGMHHCYPLQKSWNQHGKECFSFHPIEKVMDGDILLAKEIS